MNFLRCFLVLSLASGGGIASDLSLVPFQYPTHLATSQVDEEIRMRDLLFATRSPSPENIGSSLSAPYLVPHDDTSPISKNINLIHAYGIRITTDLSLETTKDADSIHANIRIDLQALNTPPNQPFPPEEVAVAAVDCLLANLKRHRCAIDRIEVLAPQGMERLRERLLKQLQEQKPRQK